VLNLPKADRLALPSAKAADTLYILTTAHNSKLIWHLQTDRKGGGGAGGSTCTPGVGVSTSEQHGSNIFFASVANCEQTR